MEEYIDVLIKSPGSDVLRKAHIKNDLKTLQDIVGGYIELVQPCHDLTAIVNEEGMIRGLPYNMKWCGYHILGTIIFCGVDGEDFADIPEYAVGNPVRWFGCEVVDYD